MLEEDFIKYSQNILRLNSELLFIVVPPENCTFEQDFEFPNLGLKLSINKKLEIIKIDDGNSPIFKHLNTTEMRNLIIDGYNNYRSSLDNLTKNLEIIKFYLKENNLLNEVEIIITGFGSHIEILSKDDSHYSIFRSSIWIVPDIRRLINLIKTYISDKKLRDIAYQKLTKLRDLINDFCEENDIEIIEGDRFKVELPDPNCVNENDPILKDLKVYQYFEISEVL